MTPSRRGKAAYEAPEEERRQLVGAFVKAFEEFLYTDYQASGRQPGGVRSDTLPLEQLRMAAN
jgi:hypothetical protein